MNLKQLKYFVKTAETGNLSRAAESMNVAQTALGLQIKNLEEELGTQLLLRHSRGVELTDAGRLLSERSRQILHLLDDTVRDIRGLVTSNRKSIRMGLTPSVMDLFGPRIFELAMSIEDIVDVQFDEGLSFRLVSALESHEIDCALAFNVSEGDYISRIALLEERLFFVSAADPDNSWKPILLADVLRTNLALLSQRDMIWQLVHDAAEFYSLDISVAYEVQSQSAIKKLVQHGAASSIMPFGAIAVEAKNGLVCARPINNYRLSRTLYLILSKGIDDDIVYALREILVPAISDEYLAMLGQYAVKLEEVSTSGQL
ncbi:MULTISPECIES: LysR family transcriptional regulator [Rhodobacterales]|jgi:LysR family nitrogen assimilation transcriptional regulator|uniref:Transcriptional regulator, LysR family n=1 Tax=Phaeobacter inhibens TaxID=221822 RepID=A0A2I7KGL1_9RHOB|nr:MULTISPECIES: LysR family transcriptional regulator [Rhodobacterales]AUR01735.1 transcriptional regulator, LysR family [Phaeobacter inhibens]